MKTNRIACLILLFVLMPAICWGWQGKVVHLDDGDPGIALYQGREIEFRLYGIDAPESHQDFGRKAKIFSSKLMLRKVVEIQILDRDRYGREVVLAFVDGKCVNEELIKAGFAWVYVHYCRNSRCDSWLRLQEKAKGNRLGLWARKSPIPPWEYRERHRSNRSSWGWDLPTRFPA